jgi:tetratricopeptide (TPR) repeat protein
VDGWRGFGETDIPQAAAAFQSLSGILVAQKKLGEAEQVLNQELTPGFVKQPSSASLLAVRVDLLGREGRWQEAAADGALLLHYQPTDHYRYHTTAPLLVANHDLPAYQALCGKIIRQFNGVTDPFTADRMAKDCLILPQPGFNLQPVSQLADTAVTLGKSGAFFPFFCCTKALAEYRGGHYPEAIAWAQKASQNSYGYIDSEASAVTAMAYHQLMQRAEAQTYLARDKALIESQMPKLASGDLGDGWRDWIISHALYTEAAALIQP